MGLGNPGPEHRGSRHNLGFEVVDQLARAHGIAFTRKVYRSAVGRGLIAGAPVALAKPLTFMNLCGEAVRDLCVAYGAKLEELIVIHDDLDLELGCLRIKLGGGDGGHRGMRSILEELGRDEFIRVRIGIGRPPEGVDPTEHVLAAFEAAERVAADAAVSRAAEAVPVILEAGYLAAMNRFN
ncbi:MAG: aminoacyl-tRNA hydrolase [Deltaproteobacteria bacterium]|nr:aminoacyl-tRNA hydrolase [Deltaproteobacteria bacterium]MBI3079156.1 aminoacyl-tRNA hydrolase [Deltaproteobacteria bacterium]